MNVLLTSVFFSSKLTVDFVIAVSTELFVSSSPENSICDTPATASFAETVTSTLSLKNKPSVTSLKNAFTGFPLYVISITGPILSRVRLLLTSAAVFAA